MLAARVEPHPYMRGVARSMLRLDGWRSDGDEQRSDGWILQTKSSTRAL